MVKYVTFLIVISVGVVANGVQNEAKVTEVANAAAAVWPSPAERDPLIIAAHGFVPDTGWNNPNLVPYVYVKPPEDGIWDFDFVASKSAGPSLALVTPIFAFEVIPNSPDWVKGVRIHAAMNSKEVKLISYEKMSLPAAAVPQFLPAEDKGVEIDLRYEDGGNKHCIVGKVRVSVAGREKTWDIGRLCIPKDGTCISGDVNLGGGVYTEWKLCIKAGPKLCLEARACYDPPIGGDICTDWKEACVAIP